MAMTVSPGFNVSELPSSATPGTGPAIFNTATSAKGSVPTSVASADFPSRKITSSV